MASAKAFAARINGRDHQCQLKKDRPTCGVRHAAPLWRPLALRWAPRSSPLSYVWLDGLGAGSHEIFDISLVVRKRSRTPSSIRAIHRRGDRLDGSVSEGTVTLTFRDHGSWRERRQRNEGGYSRPAQTG